MCVVTALTYVKIMGFCILIYSAVHVGPPYGTSWVKHIKYQNNEAMCNEAMCAFQNISLQASVSSNKNCT